MKLFKKIVVPTKDSDELLAYESWSVYWTGRKGEFASDTTKEAEVFTTWEDADRFADELRRAFKLIKHRGAGTDVIVKRNEQL